MRSLLYILINQNLITTGHSTFDLVVDLHDVLILYIILIFVIFSWLLFILFKQLLNALYKVIYITFFFIKFFIKFFVSIVLFVREEKNFNWKTLFRYLQKYHNEILRKYHTDTDTHHFGWFSIFNYIIKEITLNRDIVFPIPKFFKDPKFKFICQLLFIILLIGFVVIPSTYFLCVLEDQTPLANTSAMFQYTTHHMSEYLSQHMKSSRHLICIPFNTMGPGRPFAGFYPSFYPEILFHKHILVLIENQQLAAVNLALRDGVISINTAFSLAINVMDHIDIYNKLNYAYNLASMLAESADADSVAARQMAAANLFS